MTPEQAAKRIAPHVPGFFSTFAARMAAEGAPVYIVGGWVRDTLLGKHVPQMDMDLCGPAAPEQIVAAAERAMPEMQVDLRARDSRLGTVTLIAEFQQERLVMDYTQFRKDSYMMGGHRPSAVCFVHTPQEDAPRRDFTVNALYYRADTQALIDPLGGLDDLQRRFLRPTRKAGDVFSEDGVRVLRLVRFAASLKFDMEEEAICEAAAHVHYLKEIAPERLSLELSGIVLADTAHPERENPYTEGPVLRGLHLLEVLGAWEYLIPELREGRATDQRGRWHAYMVMEHNLRTCAATPPKLVYRLAGLLHDVGKPRALAASGKMTGHDKAGEEIARHRLGQEGLRYSNEVVERVCRIIRQHMYDLSGEAKTSTLRRRFARMGREAVEDLIMIRIADVQGSGKTKEEPEVVRRWRQVFEQMQKEGVPFSVAELAIDGKDVMTAAGIPPSQEVGRILNELWAMTIASPAQNNRKTLLRLAKSLGGKK